MQTRWRKLAGWYHGGLLTALPWIAWWRPEWAPVVTAGALGLHLSATRNRRAEPWAGSAVTLSAAAFVLLNGGWETALGWALLAALVAAVARARPRGDGARPDIADSLAVGSWGIIFALSPRLIEPDFGGWLAPALLLYGAQRIARSGPPPSATPIPGAPLREVRGTYTLESVVVNGPDGLPRSVPLELELRAGDSLAVLCDAPAEGAILSEVLCGRRTPSKGQVMVDGSPLRVDDRIVALVARGEAFLSAGLDENLAVLCDRPLDRSTLEAVHETCSLAEVKKALGGRRLAPDGSPLSAFHRMLVLVARVVPSSYRLFVVVDPVPWVNEVRGELWRNAVVRASVGRTSVWITSDRDLAERAGLVMEYRHGALRGVE